MAKVSNQHLQCKNRRRLPKNLCGLHQRILDERGELEYGWIHEEPGARSHERSRSPVAKATVEFQPIEHPQDAKKLATAMRNCSTDQMRLQLLAALHRSAKHAMVPFIQSGGLDVLTKWLRHSKAARNACLVVLQKLPVTLQDLQKSNIIPTVQAIQSQDDVQRHRVEANVLLERWKAAGFIPSKPTKREHPEAVDLAAPDEAPQAQAQAARAAPRTPPLGTLPPARPEEIPSELRKLDARVVS